MTKVSSNVLKSSRGTFSSIAIELKIDGQRALSCMCSFPVFFVFSAGCVVSVPDNCLFSTLFIHWSLFDKISEDLMLYMFPKTLTEICKIGWKMHFQW